MCMCRRAAVRPECPENSLLNLETVGEGLSHGHVAQESQTQEKLYSSRAEISCPWEVRVSLFSPCPSQVQLPAAGLASQAALFLSLPARLPDESSGNYKEEAPSSAASASASLGQGRLECSWREDQGPWPAAYLATKVKGPLLGEGLPHSLSGGAPAQDEPHQAGQAT